ncbi:hypothetical protein GCM10010269_14130 [Streptomyces humidus]|uniref:Uncharacterized protein n=1 Tax=Streptomyces humidus TaxID=52259 RepID=A0A918FTG0_9ACTN|nr:hypothetical protein [Streptomyces humidus]GGR76141.1 hypothetical protein GCM10010269_14130 [Streptomyces humidus]
MHPETHLALHRVRALELRAEADAHRLAVTARPAGGPHGLGNLRTRLGWTLVEVGLRLAAAPRTSAAAP